MIIRKWKVFVSCVCYVMSLNVSIPISREFCETTCDDKTIPRLLTYVSYHENFKLKMTVQSDLLHDHSLSPPALVLNQGWQYFYTVSFVFNAWYVLFSIYVPTYLQFILLWIFAYLFVFLYYKLACSTTCSPIMTSIVVLYIK